MNPIKVEIGQFRPMDKGTLKGFFTLLIHPEGLQIRDCRFFEKEGSRWFSFPQKEIKYTDGRKSEYIPYMKHMNRDYEQQLKIAVLEALKDVKPQEPNGQAKVPSPQRQEMPVQSDPSSLWF